MGGSASTHELLVPLNSRHLPDTDSAEDRSATLLAPCSAPAASQSETALTVRQVRGSSRRRLQLIWNILSGIKNSILMVLLKPLGDLTVWRSVFSSCCGTPRTYNPVILRTCQVEVVEPLLLEFKGAVEYFLQRRGLQPVFSSDSEGDAVDSHPGTSESLAVVIHQPEERLLLTSLMQKVEKMREQGSVILLIFLLPHNPKRHGCPVESRSMLDDNAYSQLQNMTAGCFDLYFWNLKLQSSEIMRLNKPSLDKLAGRLDQLACG